MTYSSFIVKSPFFWITLCGIFLAASLSMFTVAAAWRGKPERFRRMKWTLIPILLSCAVISVTLGIFIPPAEKILDIRLLYYLGAVIVFFFPLFRFFKILGIPYFLIILLAILSSSLVLKPWKPHREEEQLGTIRLLSLNEEGMRVEFKPRKDELPERFFSLEGNAVSPIVDILTFSDYYALLGRKQSYRLRGFNGYRAEIVEGSYEFEPLDSVYRFHEGTDISSNIDRYFQRNVEKIPGMEIGRADAQRKKPVLLRSYKLLLDVNGKLRIQQSNR